MTLNLSHTWSLPFKSPKQIIQSCFFSRVILYYSNGFVSRTSYKSTIKSLRGGVETNLLRTYQLHYTKLRLCNVHSHRKNNIYWLRQRNLTCRKTNSSLQKRVFGLLKIVLKFWAYQDFKLLIYEKIERFQIKLPLF